MTRAASRRRASALVVGALLSVLVGACSSAPAGEQLAGVRQGVLLLAPEDREAAPLQRAAPVLGADGEEFQLSDLAGEVVVVNVWGSWCGPCRAEQPDLNEAATLLADEPVTFVGVNVIDTENDALAHEREFDMPYDSVYDPDASYAATFGGIGAAAVPTTLFVDHEGRVALRLISETDTIEVLAVVERLLEQRAADLASGATNR